MLQEILDLIRDRLPPSVLYSAGVYHPIAAATDYAAEDVLADDASAGRAWVFDSVVRKEGGSARIVQAQAMWETTALTPRWTLYLFRKIPTSNLNDNVANAAPAVGDWTDWIGQIDFMSMEDLGGVSSSFVTMSTVGNLPVYFTCAERLKTIYGITVTRDAITGEAASSRVAIQFYTESL